MTETATLTLSDFLLARIAEDEEAAREGTWHDFLCASANPPDYPCDCTFPKRMVAECEAKRQIVTMMGYVLESWSANHGGPGRSLWPDVNRRERHHANETLYRLALPYADHPDYREEWRP